MVSHSAPRFLTVAEVAEAALGQIIESGLADHTETSISVSSAING